MRASSWIWSGLSVMLIAVLAGCHGASGLIPPDNGGNGGDGALNVKAYEGNWQGQWENITFGSQGNASVQVTVDEAAQTAQFVVDLDGNVLGAGDPPPITFNATYDENSLTVDGSSALFGDVSFGAAKGGALTGSATNVPNAAIDRVDVTGNATSTTITVNYTVTFSALAGGGTATGTLTLNKQ